MKVPDRTRQHCGHSEHNLNVSIRTRHKVRRTRRLPGGLYAPPVSVSPPARGSVPLQAGKPSSYPISHATAMCSFTESFWHEYDIQLQVDQEAVSYCGVSLACWLRHS